MPPGRRLVVPLHVSVLQGLRFVKARLLSMEIPAHVGKTLPKTVSNSENITRELSIRDRADKLVKFDPYRGSWGLHLLELELSNPTDVVFEVNVSVQLDTPNNKEDSGTAEIGSPRTRIDRDYSARVLIPLEHFKLPILDGSIFSKDNQKNDPLGNRVSSMAEWNTKAELNASINNLISKIKVRWQSGRNSSGELNIKDATQAALQTSVMDILLPDPLTYEFRLAKHGCKTENMEIPVDSNMETLLSDSPGHSSEESTLKSNSYISAHEMTNMEVSVRNNTKEKIRMSLNITCRDVAGENCTEGTSATVLWAGMFLFPLFL